jgi:hypothetical protein
MTHNFLALSRRIGAHCRSALIDLEAERRVLLVGGGRGPPDGEITHEVFYSRPLLKIAIVQVVIMQLEFTDLFFHIL